MVIGIEHRISEVSDNSEKGRSLFNDIRTRENS